MCRWRRLLFWPGVVLLLWMLLALPPSSLGQDDLFACSGEGDVRLVGEIPGERRNEKEGRVELCLNGKWGTICDDDWDSRDAYVVCRQLGYPSEFSVASKFARFGRGQSIGTFQPIHRDEVRCTGLEQSIADCPHNETRQDCNHSEDAGVICQDDTCSDGEVRLIDGTDAKEGRVEVCFNNTWGYICESGFTEVAAAVVCRELGLDPQGAQTAQYAPGLGPVHLEKVECGGSEDSIGECSFNVTEGVCSRHAGVQCEAPCTSPAQGNLTECGTLFHLPGSDSGGHPTERCFCTSDCVNFGDCCRDFLRLDDLCTDSDIINDVPVCDDGDIRLVNGTRNWNGRLEVCLRGTWGSVCEARFDDRDAAVVCKELGYPAENAFAIPGNAFGFINVIWLAGVECRGHEANLTECQSMGPGNFIPCRFPNATGVWCAGAAPPECTEGDIRLVDGVSNSSGRVEVCQGGIWGTICNHQWDNLDAAVVCKQMGYNPELAVAIPEGVFGGGTGPVILDEVECVGSETSVVECTHLGTRVHRCFISQEAGVSCRDSVRVQQCESDSFPDISQEAIDRFGVCEPYNVSTINDAICDRVFTEGEDYVYLPNRRGLENQESFQRALEEELDAAFSTASEDCRELFSRYICNSFFVSCGEDGALHPPTSVCPEDCETVRRQCEELWLVLMDSGLGEDVGNCNTTGDILEPLPHCCTDGGIRSVQISDDSSFNIARIVGASVGGAVVLVLLLLAVPCCVIAVYLMNSRRKVKNLKRSLSIGYNHNHPSVELRGSIIRSEGRESWTTCISPGTHEAEKLFSDSPGPHTKSIRYARNPHLQSPPPLPSPRVLHELMPPRPLSPLTASYIRQISTHMLIPSSQIRLLDSIGQGEFGIVYKAHLLKPVQEAMRSNVAPKTVAVKTLKGSFDHTAIREVLQESVKMKSFNHPNVLNLIGVCVDAGPAPYIIMPFMDNGSLLFYLRKERSRLILPEGTDEDQVSETKKSLLGMCSQIARGMEYLSERKFIHRDLASRNCMIDAENVIKVSDFGLSEDIYSKNYFHQGKDSAVKLPVKWMAPESLNDGIFSEKTDVWSFGVTCWEVFSGGKSPYPGLDPLSVIKMLERGERMEKPVNTACSDEMYELMIECWQHDPHSRPYFSKIVRKISSILEPLAGYLELSTIANHVSNEAEDEVIIDEQVVPRRITREGSLAASKLKKGVVTSVGIAIHLERWSSPEEELTSALNGEGGGGEDQFGVTVDNPVTADGDRPGEEIQSEPEFLSAASLREERREEKGSVLLPIVEERETSVDRDRIDQLEYPVNIPELDYEPRASSSSHSRGFRSTAV